MILPLFVALILLLGGFSLWLGKRTAKTSHSQDFFLMGRGLGLFGLIMALLATQIGGGALLGAAEEAYTRGWSVICYPLGMVLGLVVLGSGYGAKMRQLQISTIPEIFEKIYGSMPLRKVASLLSILSLFFILVGQGTAAHKFFLSLGFHGHILFLAFWSILIIYTTMGGLAASAKTEMFQAAFIIITLVVAFCAVWWHSPTSSPIDTMPQTVTTPWFSWLILPLLFMLIEQDMGQWCFAAKNPRIVSIASLIAALVLLLISLVPLFFGVLAGQKGLVVPHNGSVLIAAATAFTNPVVATFMSCAVLMAILSTANALLCSVSANIYYDFSLSRSSFPLLSRLITLCVGLSALILSLLFKNVIMILMFAYDLAVCVLFVPITLAIWKRHVRTSSAIVSMIVGFLLFVLCKIWTPSFPKELICLGTSLAAFLLSEWYHSRKSREASR